MRFRKLPMEVDAIKFNRTELKAAQEFMGEKDVHLLRFDNYRHEYYIRTLEGEVHMATGDWLVRGIKGEYYPVRSDIFNQTYEAIAL